MTTGPGPAGAPSSMPTERTASAPATAVARAVSLPGLPGLLRELLGPQDDWWDVDTPFEVLVGSVLVQNTSWRGVARSLDRLRAAGVASPAALVAVPTADLVELIRPTGFPVAKERALRGLCAWWDREVGGFSVGAGRAGAFSIDEGDAGSSHPLFADAPLLPERSTGELRAGLLALRGVGPETADVVLLHLLGRGRFVADSYARRLFVRLGWDVPRSYDAFAVQVHDRLDLPVPAWREFHALIDVAGQAWCRSDAGWDAGPLAGRQLVSN